MILSYQAFFMAWTKFVIGKEYLMLQGLILGLSNGTACLASCAPVMLPYILGGGKSIRNNLSDLLFFLSGRMSGYISFGILAWFTGRLLLHDPVIRSRFLGISFLALGVMLIVNNLTGNRRTCRLKNTANGLTKILSPDAWYYPFIFGLLTGINVCPPFLLVFTDAVNSGSLLGSVIFFATFFIGTSIFFMPFPLIGVLKNKVELKIVGELALYLIAGYYLFKGILSLGGTF
jgi:sulfite exporter TauE/SafE